MLLDMRGMRGQHCRQRNQPLHMLEMPERLLARHTPHNMPEDKGHLHEVGRHGHQSYHHHCVYWDWNGCLYSVRLHEVQNIAHR